MKFTKHKILFISLILLSLQLYSQKQSDSIVFQALNDEIIRGMNEFDYKDYAKPCYIGYVLIDENTLSINSEIGALMSYDNNKNIGWSYRLIIGTYEINDENFRGIEQHQNNGIGNMANFFPLEADYYGIRRGFWLNSDNVFRRAGNIHKQKQSLITKNIISKDDLNLPDYTKEEAVTRIIERAETKINKSNLKEKICKLSEAVYEFDNISYSSSNLTYKKNDIYFVNNEGTTFKIPLDLSLLNVNLSKKIKNNKYIHNSFFICRTSPKKFPTNEALQPEIEKLANNLIELSDAENIKEDYSGPVLFLGQVAAEIMLQSLFCEKNSLIAERNDLVAANSGDVYFENIENEWQSRIEKKILPQGISVVARPKLKEYHGINLIGNFEIDSEGVIPPDSIVLVKDGFLKAMLSSRTPTSVSSCSNGHYRFYFGYNGVSHTKSPGIIIMESNIGKPTEILTDNLLEIAKEEGNKYAYIIQSIPSKIVNMPYNIYRIDVESREKEIINRAGFDMLLGASDLKKIQFSDSIIVFNTLFRPQNAGFYMGFQNNYNRQSTGVPVSFICPNGILVKEFEIFENKDIENIHTDKDYISNPLENALKN